MRGSQWIFSLGLCGVILLGWLAHSVGAALSGTGCHIARTCPAKDGSYAWQPLRASVGLTLTCHALTGPQPPAEFNQLVDYGGAGYACQLPNPRDLRAHGSVDFFGPQTVSAGSVPLKQDELRLSINVSGRPADILRVAWGDGTSWQRALGGAGSFELTHSYARTHTYYLLVTLRDLVGYVAVEGVGPFEAPPPGPRARRCRFEDWGKGWTLSASEALTCAQAQTLFASFRRSGKLAGYRCSDGRLSPYGSDVGVYTCVNGSRLFVLTSVP
jgi:hypothetical protein